MGILNEVDKPQVEQETASRYIDLNINQIADAVSDCWGGNVARFYALFPDNRDAEQYRRDIYSEIESEGLYEGLCEAYGLAGRVTKLDREREKMPRRQQRMLSHVHEVRLYCKAADGLQALIGGRTFTSKGLIWFQKTLAEYTGSSEYIKMRDEVNELCAAIDGLKVTFVYENDRLQVAVTEGEPVGEDSRLTSPFKEYSDICGLEFALIIHLSEKRPKLFKQLRSFFGDYEEYRAQWLMQFYDDITFYLSYMKFEKHMREHGFGFSMSTVDETAPMKADGLYDLALAVANIKRNRPVIDNDFIYDGTEQFFVLTGPNQGGKTTFARSLGQLVYLTKLGLKAPAKAANIHYFDDLLTHFSVEESIETGRGKLMEELVRLRPMMAMSGRYFVVINELFTTAANYDACIMGRRVLQHFIADNCCGIYVTHLSELLEGTEHAAGLCAQLDENGVQTFKILRRVMEYNNVAAAQVRKYKLGYDELASRLAGRETV